MRLNFRYPLYNTSPCILKHYVPSELAREGRAPPHLFQNRTLLNRRCEPKTLFWHPSFARSEYWGKRFKKLLCRKKIWTEKKIEKSQDQNCLDLVSIPF